nr:succinate dehydrogenase cytochrome b556 subunit [Vibrio aerogenes]
MSEQIVKEKSRPVNLDLQTIRFPVTAIASILHRMTGVMMFVAIGILLWLLSVSLSSPEGFQYVSDIAGHFFMKFILWGILTALSYHIVGGVRHLIMDLGYFEELESGTQTAKIAFGATVFLSLLAGILVW